MPESWYPPKLTDHCGKHFSYRDFVHCSSTWHALEKEGKPIANLPKQAATWNDISQLCKSVLDPATDRFGKVTLTYAFASNELDRAVRERARKDGRMPNTTRNGDQHAGSELNSRGKLICGRRGIAVDFKIEGIASDVIARWIVANTPFDRLYYYGDERPLHVSVGPDNSRLRWNRRKPSTEFDGRRRHPTRLRRL